MNEYKLKTGRIGKKVTEVYKGMEEKFTDSSLEKEYMMEDHTKRTVSVLLTRYYSAFSNFIYWVSGRGYTHASIALDGENDCYYSFNFKGFRREYPGRHKRKCGKSVCYQLEVSNESFHRIKREIEEMERKSRQLHYSRISVLLSILHIPCRIKNHYFCSQFVAEMLLLSGSILLEKTASLYLPNQLPEELCRQGCLKEITYNPV